MIRGSVNESESRVRQVEATEAPTRLVLNSPGEAGPDEPGQELGNAVQPVSADEASVRLMPWEGTNPPPRCINRATSPSAMDPFQSGVALGTVAVSFAARRCTVLEPPVRDPLQEFLSSQPSERIAMRALGQFTARGLRPCS